MNPSDFAIEVRDVKRSFRSIKKEEGLKGTLKLLYKPEYLTHEALKGVSFQIQKGEFTGLIGANGAGKTTLLKILSGLIPPTSGEAKVLGFTPFDRSIEFRKQISIVMGQKAQLWWDLPAIEAFDLIRALYQIPREIYRKRVDELTSLLDVTKLLSTQIRRLSLGERMKMEVIGAILHLPKVIFLDEPTIGLDVLASKKLREFLRAHNQREGATIILTSHNMDDISELCKRVLLIKEGSLIFDGNPKRLTEQDECVLKVKLLSAPTLTEVSSVLSIPNEQVSMDEEDPTTYVITITRSKITEYFQKLLASFQVADIGIQEASLERVIQRIYQS
ncbi:MAG: ATP-binding cassette domain-containing protein [Bdellovibrionales bacterium]|nr:ATP-binding cassette domain-containing protein [Bdellovibrionales bacterium]